MCRLRVARMGDDVKKNVEVNRCSPSGDDGGVMSNV